MKTHKFAIALVLAGCGLWAQTGERAQSETAYQVSGPEMYRTYCAVCHGTDGKGAGPAAKSFRVKPTDLTTLTKKHGGKFPGAEIAKELKSVYQAPHGSHDMPIWGAFFEQLSPKDDAVATLRITNLVNYIESIQAK